jgi:hypothetical protein
MAADMKERIELYLEEVNSLLSSQSIACSAEITCLAPALF